ncbi:MAG: lipopolysaccharide biosynthesis protein [Rhodocyclaceae bacterium]
MTSPQMTGALMRGTLWSLALRWFTRAIGLVSTIVLARLLLPDDYGVVAMAMLVTGLVEVFLASGADNALLRQPNATREYADSAWTMKVIEALIIAATVAAIAPLAAWYFKEPRVEPVMWALSLGFVIAGCGSVGPLLARKELNFALEVRLGVIAKVISFVVTVACAWWLRNYWALVIGVLTGHLSGAVLSYVLHAYRPRWSLQHVRELWSYSQWLLVSGIGNYFATKIDEFAAGRIGTPAELGLYRVSSELGTMVSTELGAPINRALLPVLAAMQSEPERMRRALMKTVAAVNTLTLPAGVGLALVAKPAVAVLLGAQWTGAVPYLQVFALLGAVRFIVGPYYTIFMATGQSRVLAKMSWCELILFAAFAIPLSAIHGVPGLAAAKLCSSVPMVMLWILLGHRHGLRFGELVRQVARPLAGCALMALVLWWMPVVSVSALVDLVVRMMLGAVAYGVWMAVSWHRCGRPEGVESMLFRRVALWFGRRPQAGEPS